MTATKKKLHTQIIDKAKDWDEKMKKYRFYKEVVKDFLLMIPLLGSVGGSAQPIFFENVTIYAQRPL